MDQKSESDELKELVGKELNVLRGDRGGAEQGKFETRILWPFPCGKFLCRIQGCLLAIMNSVFYKRQTQTKLVLVNRKIT